jgi:hypothetical protein
VPSKNLNLESLPDPNAAVSDPNAALSDPPLGFQGPTVSSLPSVGSASQSLGLPWILVLYVLGTIAVSVVIIAVLTQVYDSREEE